MMMTDKRINHLCKILNARTSAEKQDAYREALLWQAWQDGQSKKLPMKAGNTVTQERLDRLKMLERLIAKEREVTAPGLARMTGLHKSVVQNELRILCANGKAHCLKRKTYMPGPEAAE